MVRDLLGKQSRSPPALSAHDERASAAVRCQSQPRRSGSDAAPVMDTGPISGGLYLTVFSRLGVVIPPSGQLGD